MPSDTSASSNPSIEQLTAALLNAATANRFDDVARIGEQMLKRSPENPQALYHLGWRALLCGNPAEARDLLMRAAAAAPAEHGVHLALALALRHLGDAGTEMQALERALALNPYSLPALLGKASLLERQGRTRAAARIYTNALSITPPPAQLDPQLRQATEHARKVVAENQAALETQLRPLLNDARARHSSERLDRFDECLDAMLGKKRIYGQQPVMLHFPQLPAIQFHEREQFAWLQGIEAAADAIRVELEAVLAEDHPQFAPYVAHPPGVPLNQWAELNNSRRWGALFLWRDGQRIEEQCRRFPRTCAALESVPLAQVPNRGPTVFFSALEPHTHIPAHTGDTNTRLICHLALVVPPACRFRVGNDVREWQRGQAWIFDDTIEHEAWNDSDELRVVLIFDVWNPLLSVAERELVGVMMNGIDDYYRGGAQ